VDFGTITPAHSSPIGIRGFAEIQAGPSKRSLILSVPLTETLGLFQEPYLKSGVQVPLWHDNPFK